MRRWTLLLSLLITFGAVLVWLGMGEAAPTRTALVLSGGPVTNVRVLTGTVPPSEGSETHSTSLSQLPGASTILFIPKTRRTFLLMRFSASAWCQGPANQHCSVVIRVNNQEAYPQGGLNAKFDSGLAENAESHSIDRVSENVRPGLNRVQVMWATSNAAITFRAFQWTLIVEQVRRP
jgi:hypothetical protein